MGLYRRRAESGTIRVRKVPTSHAEERQLDVPPAGDQLVVEIVAQLQAHCSGYASDVVVQRS